MLQAGKPPGAGVLAVVAQQVVHEAHGAGLAVAQLQQGAPVPDGGEAQHHHGDRQREPASLWNLRLTLSCPECLPNGLQIASLRRLTDKDSVSSEVALTPSVQHCG